MNGLLVVDKPAGPTSHDVVSRVRKILQQRSVGHLGTLDPQATGVLPLVVGNFTRLSQFYVSSEKTYEGVIRFGFSTDTYDADGEPVGPVQAVTLSYDKVHELACMFCGAIEQTPPPFSAKKIAGVPAYKLARRHVEVPLKPVRVEIRELLISSVEGDRVHFRSCVSSGTYVRSLAHDMGQRLGCGAHLESLRRMASAEFTLEDAHSLEEIEAAVKEQRHEEVFVHPRKLLPALPSVTASEESAAYIRHGRAVNLPEFSTARMIKVFCGQRELIAIATRIAGTLFHPKLVLAGEPKVRVSSR